jgi:hypothetical protein
VPTILGGLAVNTEMELLPGLYPWVKTELTPNPMDYTFEKLALLDRLYFAHPVKIMSMEKARFCQVIIQHFWAGSKGVDELRREYEPLLTPLGSTTLVSGRESGRVTGASRTISAKAMRIGIKEKRKSGVGLFGKTRSL